MPVEIIKFEPGVVINPPITRTFLADDGFMRALGFAPSISIVIADTFAVWPVSANGFLLDDVNDGLITNINATYQIVSQDALDGSFTFKPFGDFEYSRGTQTGTATWTYEVLNATSAGGSYQQTEKIHVK